MMRNRYISNILFHKLLSKKNAIVYKGKKILFRSEILRKNLYKYQKIKNPLFKSVEIETTSVCNRKCVYCPNFSYQRAEGYMEESLFYKIINELSELKFSGRFSPHFYGEPLLDNRLVDFISYARKMLPNVLIKLFTNGDLLSYDLFLELTEAGVDIFKISQHGKHPSKQLSNTLKQLDDKTLKKQIEYVKYIGNKEVKLMNRGGLVDYNQNNVMKFCNQVLDLVIDFEGNVLLCCQDFLSKHKYGNLKKERILDVWNKPYYKEHRDKILYGMWPLKICKICARSQNNMQNSSGTEQNIL